MLGQNCYSYIKIGLAIRLLMNLSETNPKNFVADSLQSLTEELKSGNFEVTLAAMESEAYVKMKESIDALENDTDAIGSKLTSTIHKEISKIETVVFPESCIKKIYVLPNRRFNTDYLLNHPEKLLAKGTYEKLDEIARHDIASACRCLLFGEATASAFHILRATE